MILNPRQRLGRRVAAKAVLTFLAVSYLLTFVLIMACFWSDIEDAGDWILSVLVSGFVSAFLFGFVAELLAYILMPLAAMFGLGWLLTAGSKAAERISDKV
jgi:hypothetical protein